MAHAFASCPATWNDCSFRLSCAALLVASAPLLVILVICAVAAAESCLIVLAESGQSFCALVNDTCMALLMSPVVCRLAQPDAGVASCTSCKRYGGLRKACARTYEPDGAILLALTLSSVGMPCCKTLSCSAHGLDCSLLAASALTI